MVWYKALLLVHATAGADLFIAMHGGGDELAHGSVTRLGHSDGAARRTAVHAALAAAAASSQREVLRAAADAGARCQSFWIVNAIVCRDAPRAFEDRLRGGYFAHAVHHVRPLGALRRVSPVGGDAAAAAPPAKPLSSLPSDAGWNVQLVGAASAWNTTRGEGVVAAIIDGGVRHTHEALVDSFRGTVAASSGGRARPSFDFDYNWFDPVYKNKSPEGSDTDGHGTHVTGTVAGAKGIGAAPGAKWIHAKACNFAGYCSDDWAIATAQWVMCPTPVGSTAADCSKGADIVSCSWGDLPGGDDYMRNVTSAWEAAGMLGVFAVGNNGPDCSTVASPADYPHSLGVGATDKGDGLTDFSSRGPSDDAAWTQVVPRLVAPGNLVPSSYFKDDSSYYHLSGTSQACPLVAGTAALVKSANAALSPAQIRALLASSASSSVLSQPSSGKEQCGGIKWSSFPNHIYGYGRLNASAAVQAALDSAQGSLVPAHPPRWPASFSANITEIRTAKGSGNTTGSWAYDAQRRGMRVDRDDGEYDQLCGSAGGAERCTVLATGGARYLIWPARSHCCVCCTDADGCGAETPGWLDNATYVGPDTFSGVATDKFEIQGYKPNYWWQRVSDGAPVALQQADPHKAGQDLDAFDQSTLSLDPVDAAVFQVPQYCPSSTTAKAGLCPGFCALIRFSHSPAKAAGDAGAVKRQAPRSDSE
jgi:subtilisin family serine protease